MNLRADHVAGAFFILFGLLVHALSGDLPTGQLSMPGSGFLPKIVATLTIIFGLMLIVRAAKAGRSPSVVERRPARLAGHGHHRRRGRAL